MSKEREPGTRFATEAEARAIVERARRLRAETLHRLIMVGWARLAARRDVGTPMARA